jgi:hypothetical protein
MALQLTAKELLATKRQEGTQMWQTLQERKQAQQTLQQAENRVKRLIQEEHLLNKRIAETKKKNQIFEEIKRKADEDRARLAAWKDEQAKQLTLRRKQINHFREKRAETLKTTRDNIYARNHNARIDI